MAGHRDGWLRCTAQGSHLLLPRREPGQARREDEGDEQEPQPVPEGVCPGTPSRCLAIDDSPSGVRAAKAAGMACIAVPDRLLQGDPAYAEADVVLGALTELDERVLRSVGVRISMRTEGEGGSGRVRRSADADEEEFQA